MRAVMTHRDVIELERALMLAAKHVMLHFSDYFMLVVSAVGFFISLPTIADGETQFYWWCSITAPCWDFRILEGRCRGELPCSGFSIRLTGCAGLFCGESGLVRDLGASAFRRGRKIPTFHQHLNPIVISSLMVTTAPACIRFLSNSKAN